MYDNVSVQLLPRLTLTSADIGRSVFSVAVGLLAMGGNGFLLLLVVKYRSLRKNDCIYLIACLALCDFLLGLGCISFGISSVYLRTMIDHYPNKFECMIFGVIGIFGVQAGQLATLAIAFDRFVALSEPIKYMQINHTAPAIRWAIGIFVYTTMVIVAEFVNVDLQEKPAVCNTGGSVTVAWATYWSSFSLLNGIAIAVLYCTGYLALVRKYAQMENNTQLKRAIERQNQISNSITLVMLVYSVCWLFPNVVLFLFGVLDKPDLYGLVTPLAAVGSGVNSSVNVLIYGCKHDQIRAHMRKFLSGATTGDAAIFGSQVRVKKVIVGVKPPKVV